MIKRRAIVITSIAMVIMAALSAMAPAALADGGDFSLDFVAAGPFTYDHDTGVGGEFADRTISKTDGVVESLEGGDFECGDLVVYFTEVTVEAGASGEQDIELDFGFLAEPTGQPGVGHVDLVSVSPNTGDSGMSGDTNDTTASIVPGTEEIDTSGPSDELVATIAIGNLDPGEVFILRLVTELGCILDSDPTGNLQAEIHAGRVVSPIEDVIAVGNQTIPFQSLSDISQPGSVSVSVGACTAPGSPTVPVTVEISPAGAATVTISGPGGPYVVTGSGDTLDLEPGDYTWTAVAEPGFILTGDTAGAFTVQECPFLPSAVSIQVGSCPEPGSPTVPVTITIDPDSSATVTIEGPGGPYVVTGDGDILDLPPGDYTWTAEAAPTYELEVDSGEFTVQPCPAILASVTVVVEACPPTSSLTRPVTITINPAGAAVVTVTGPTGFSTVVDDGATLDLEAGDYSWTAVANPTYEIIGPSEGTFSVGSCVIEVLPKEIPKTGTDLPGLAAVALGFLLLGVGMVTVSNRRRMPATGSLHATLVARFGGRHDWSSFFAAGWFDATPVTRRRPRRSSM